MYQIQPKALLLWRASRKPSYLKPIKQWSNKKYNIIVTQMLRLNLNLVKGRNVSINNCKPVYCYYKIKNETNTNIRLYFRPLTLKKIYSAMPLLLGLPPHTFFSFQHHLQDQHR